MKLISPQPDDAWFWLQVRSQESTQANNPIGILSEEKLRIQISESNSDISDKKSVHRYFIQVSEKEFAGVISLKDINWESGVCEIGYLIAEKYQNQGVASKAVALIMEKAFAVGIKKIKATTFIKNVASYKVLQKNGFILEGHLKNEVLIQGQLQDMYLWAAGPKGAAAKLSDLNSGVRHASINDAEVIHHLSHQLGYNPSFEDVQTYLGRILVHADYEVLVIENDEKVCGWMTLNRRYRIEDVEFLQVAALVTDERVRGHGFGKALMNFAEKRAREMRLPFVGLYSNQRRTEAHGFYERLGYTKSKESFFFIKDFE
ncbi:MAG: GNAT family N-acetyltransferase [Bdellovibrionaceae bacterium]|nr:GNAT family N-acetyltransferase [Pseudobdellovibrionaceae bacterium]